MAAERGADLLLGNNVLAHVPDLNDFVAGMKLLLNDASVLLNLLAAVCALAILKPLRRRLQRLARPTAAPT